MFTHRCKLTDACIPKGAPRQARVPRAARATGRVWVALAFLAAASGTSWAHLSIIRQGHEAAGAFEAGDRTGQALAAGDFNGDGRDDLAMGAPLENLSGGHSAAGAVIVSYGSPTGITHVASVALTAAGSGGVNQTDARFGYSLLAGDWNNDGYDDLAVGCPGDRLGLGIRDAGMVYLLQGSPSGLQPWIQLDQADGFGTPEVGDLFGHALGAGDFNGDGRLDLVVGSPGEDGSRGAVFFFMNSAIGVPFGGSGWIDAAALGTAGNAGDAFGFALAGGDLVGGGEDDLAVGVPFFDDAEPNAGAFWIIRGSSSGLSASGAVLYTGWDLGQEIEGGAALGYSLAAGRLFGGEFDALAVGEPFRTVAGRSGAGQVRVCPGSSSGLQGASTVFLRSTTTGQQPQNGEHFGRVLAVGSFQEPNPGFDDLAVGLPGRLEDFEAPVGQIQVFPGTPSGPSSIGAERFDQSRLGDWLEPGAEFGTALVFGRFDGSPNGALAAGAPGDEADAGQVHVIAPWRQALDLSCRHSVAYDCEGDLVFSQRPFDQVMIASTTKTMTVLIAAERSQLPPNDPRYVSLDQEYTVAAWVAEQIPGSQVPLMTGERITLIDLMYACMLRSGNDAANAIADLLYFGAGPNIALPLFVSEMNQRAAELGMTGTNFHNPAGLDNEPVGPELGEHYSTPVDMGILSRAAVNNPLVAQIASTTSYPMTRRFGLPGGLILEQPWVCENIFTGVLNNNIQPATGIKGGGTPGAQITGLFSAQTPSGGTALAGTYLLPMDQGNRYVPDAAGLLQVGLTECGSPLVFMPQSLPFLRNFPGLPTRDGAAFGGLAEFPVDLPRGAGFSLLRQSGESDVRALLEIGRISETLIPCDGSVRYGIGPFQAHQGYRIANMGADPVTLVMRADYPAGFGAVASLQPGESYLLEPEQSPEQLSDFGLTILNDCPGGIEAYLSVEEIYSFEVQIPGFSQMEGFEADLLREGDLISDGFWFRVTGGDPEGDGELHLSVHEQGVAVDVPELEADRIPSTILAEVSAAPNPFRTATRISFELGEPAEVGLTVFDAQGRQVREAPARSLPAGRWSVEWDGRDTSGNRLPQGVYFYTILRDGRPEASGKVVRTE